MVLGMDGGVLRKEVCAHDDHAVDQHLRALDDREADIRVGIVLVRQHRSHLAPKQQSPTEPLSSWRGTTTPFFR